MAITDTGCGDAAAHMSQVFEPFFSTKPPRTRTGLGLAVAYQPITGHGGHTDIARQLSQGTTLTLTLPLAEGIDNA
jgi:signal transduction histidine kinase